MLECLDNLVGLVDSPCACYDGSKPVDFDTLNASTTGLYLNQEVPSLDGLFGSLDCSGDNIFTELVSIRRRTLDTIARDLPVALLKTLKSSVPVFDGEIGERTATSTRPVNTFAGIQIRPRPRRDGFFVIEGIYAGSQSGGAKDVTIRSNDPDFADQIESITFGTGVFQYNALDTPLRLPMFSTALYTDPLRYAFFYDATADQPLANKFWCCGSGPAYTRTIQPGGMDHSNADNFVAVNYDGRVANGLVLKGYFTCDNLEWMCDMTARVGETIKNTIASAKVYKGGELLAQTMLDSRNVNAIKLLGEKGLYATRNRLKKQYEDNIMWVAHNIPANVSGCYECKDPLVRKRSL